ncbi:protein broad-minded-like isoform X1 [Acropora palmata]|uniref:protein broad-minded-like isoform X1 n=1 Tax=Acropora palmata TaxID=6131 RepID=UPI003DA13AAE
MERKEPDGHDNFFASLNQLILSLEPAIKEAGSVAAAEDILTHLEATDENFHKYDFVRQLRSRIDTTLTPVIDKKLEQLTGREGDQNSSIPAITEEIIASPEFVNLQQSILADTKDAVNALIQTYSQNPRLRLSDYELTENRGRLQGMPPFRISVDSSDEDSSLSSSFGQVGFMFNMSPEKFSEIAEDLDPVKPLNVRIKALNTLYQFPLSDELTSKNSEGIRKGLLAALADDDEQLADKSLKFHARMFMASSAQVTKEIYTCLAEHLCYCFTDSHIHQVNMENGFDVSTRGNMRLLKRFRLLNEFQHEVSSFWIRYPEWFLESVLESTFNLLSTSPDGGRFAPAMQRMTPLHFLALVDPKATWFKKWMHGNYSRTVAMKELKKHPSLLADAVSHCMDFSRTCKTLQSLDMFELNEQCRDNESDGLFYTSQDLEYIYFVHSLCLLGRILLYSGGRALFPVVIPDMEEKVAISDLLAALIRIMCTSLPTSSEYNEEFHPGVLVCDMLKEIACCTNSCKECLCKDTITTSLLSPVQSWLDGVDGNEIPGVENTLLLVADVLATLAVSETGQRQLLYGETQDRWQRNRFSPAHTIAQFAKKALSDRLSGGTPSKAVIAGFVYVCRQLYNTCDGLMVLSPYELHQCVANAWIKVHETASSVTGEMTFAGSSAHFISDDELTVWESSLVDNLLNFAGTPKGLLLLQQTGKMNECVAYMNERYKKKLQVSKCEKFGYGVMVTQIAATAPGMVALEKKGFLKRLVHDIWTVFEGGQDRKPAPPRIKHVDSIDTRSYNKSLNNLLSVLSAFPAVYEVLADAHRPSTSGSEVEETITSREGYCPPECIMDFVDRFIMIDSEEKVHSLFNFEQSHHFGLRVLSVLCSCLDTFLFLECRYRFQELMLQSQLDNKLENGEDFIIDMCSVERNHILVKTYLIGGPSERIIPGKTLTEDVDNPYPWPLFSAYPPPKDYLPVEQICKMTTFGEDVGDPLLEFLENSQPLSADSSTWLQECRRTFCESLISGKSKPRGKVLPLLLENVCTALTNITEEAIFPLIDFSASESSLKNVELSEIENLGTKVTVRYGVQLKLLQSSTEGIEDLTYLLKYSKFFLRGQQRSTDVTLRTLSGEYVGHDWFVSTIFLMMYGDPDQAWEFLFKCSSLVSSGYLWVRRLHTSVHLPVSLTVSGIPPLYSCSCHNVELVLEAEVPLVFSAFRMSGYTPSQICQHWLRQCFWNYLDWEEICLYISTCLTMGIDYQVYFCIAIFRHLQQDILRKTQQQHLLIFLKENPIQNFKVAEQLSFMQELEARYRPSILSDLQNITKP